MNNLLHQRIEKHGQQLLAIFPNCLQSDPVKLCKKLRRFETKLNKAAENLCNIPNFDIESVDNEVMPKVAHLLGSDRVHFNRDPRGYALKIDLLDSENLATDWGGYGLIAPDLREG